MCKIVEELQNIIKKESKHSCQSDFKWQPLPSSICQKDCEDSLKLLWGLVDFLAEEIKPVIDPLTTEVIEEVTHPKLATKFSELNNILESGKVPESGKAALIRVPDQDQISRFLQEVFTSWRVTREVLVLAKILLDRFLHRTQWRMRSTTWRTFILLTIKIASKLEGRLCFSNKDMESAYPIHTAQQYFELELLFLDLVDYQCYVSLKEYGDYVKQMIKA